MAVQKNEAAIEVLRHELKRLEQQMKQYEPYVELKKRYDSICAALTQLEGDTSVDEVIAALDESSGRKKPNASRRR